MDSIFPSRITAGFTFRRLVTQTAYPAPDWVLSVVLRGPRAITLTATPEGTQHRLEALPAATREWLGGAYAYSVRATSADGADVVELERGSCQVDAGLDGLEDGHDARSHARKVLDSINAVIEKRATQDQARYVINNRELERTPIADLLLLRDRYAAMVRQEEAGASGRSLWGPAVRVRL